MPSWAGASAPCSCAVNETKSDRYHRLKRRTRVVAALGGSLLLGTFLLAGGSVWLREAAEALAGGLPPAGRPWAVVAVYVTVLFLAAEALAVPLAFYQGFVLERRYGLGRQSAASWVWDSAKAGLVGLVLSLAAAEFTYWALRWSGTWWWAAVTAGFAGFTVLSVYAAPVVLFPLFFRFEPLAREDLRARLLDLARRAGTPALGVFEWKLGEKSRAANAALVGLGATRRILVSDTLLADYSDDEVEVVLAHELAHHEHGDLRHMVAADAGVTLVTLLACHAALAWAGPALRLRGPADVAGLPVLLLAGGVVSLLSLPLVNAWSRAHERRADARALDLTGNPAAFLSALRRLGVQNLADEHPSRFAEWLFHSHPPLPQRLDMARAWAAEHGPDGAAAPLRDPVPD
jgi:STE24 endopeptidase